MFHQSQGYVISLYLGMFSKQHISIVSAVTNSEFPGMSRQPKTGFVQTFYAEELLFQFMLH